MRILEQKERFFWVTYPEIQTQKSGSTAHDLSKMTCHGDMIWVSLALQFLWGTSLAYLVRQLVTVAGSPTLAPDPITEPSRPSNYNSASCPRIRAQAKGYE